MSPAASRAPRWTWVAFVLLLAVPIIEIAVIIAVGKVIGGWPTLLLLLAESALGAYLVKREGRAAWAALREALSTGRMPAGELSDAALVLVGGTLLLTPGFVSDVLGFACVLPGTRVLARRVLARVVTRHLLAAGPGVQVWATGTPRPSAGGPGPRHTASPGAARDPYRRPDEDDIIEGEVL